MSAATPLRATSTGPRPRPALRVVPAPPRAPRRGHDGVFALCLATLLTVGILGVLLLNTAMQQQADRIAGQRALIARLVERAQALRVDVDAAADPTVLAARAWRLHMRPAHRLGFVDLPVRSPGPAAGPGRAG